jgi:hypothetical protein
MALASGRQGHDDKVTVYINTDELVRLQNEITALRAKGIKVDRGRFIRQALADVLDLDQAGKEAFAARLAQPSMNQLFD